jgi:hypothetical protein
MLFIAFVSQYKFRCSYCCMYWSITLCLCIYAIVVLKTLLKNYYGNPSTCYAFVCLELNSHDYLFSRFITHISLDRNRMLDPAVEIFPWSGIKMQVVCALQLSYIHFGAWTLIFLDDLCVKTL